MQTQLEGQRPIPGRFQTFKHFESELSLPRCRYKMRISKLFTDYFRQRRHEIDVIMFDIDGTLIRGSAVLPGAVEFLKHLKCESFPLALLTNDGTRSTQQKARLLSSMGFQLEGDDIVSCADTIVNYVRQYERQGHRVFVMGELGKPCYAERAHLKTTRDINKLSTCDGVIVGEADYDWEPTFNAVINFFIRNPNAFLIVPNPDTYWPTEKKEINIGAGGKARFITRVLEEYGVCIEPVYLGKPSPTIFQYALNHLTSKYGLVSNLSPSRVLHVGDSLTSDVYGANNMNFTSVLLLTGITTKAHVRELNSSESYTPDLIFEML